MSCFGFFFKFFIWCKILQTDGLVPDQMISYKRENACKTFYTTTAAVPVVETMHSSIYPSIYRKSPIHYTDTSKVIYQT